MTALKCNLILSSQRLPSGFALEKSLGPRGAKFPPLGNLLGLGGFIFQYIPPLGSVRIQYCCTFSVGNNDEDDGGDVPWQREDIIYIEAKY